VVFSSHLFVFYFLPSALLLYFLAPAKFRNLVLTVVSYVFYGWTNPLFVLLMLASTLIDFVSGWVMTWHLRPEADGRWPLLSSDQPRSRLQKVALGCSVVSNLAMLGFFKYWNFGVEVWHDMLVSWFGADGNWDHVLRVTLPLGISFYTFQTMSYCIDVYRGEARPIRNVIDFACFVAMFPQLVAGPILRFQDVANQLHSRTHTREKFARGVAFFGLGLAKKVLLANPCGEAAKIAFDAAELGCVESWLGAIAYAFQIYFDFSGYSDMAIGMGLMLGFVFSKNFDSPYQSKSITEFWRRWHLSLSTWLRDYLYVPLGGNRCGTLRTYLNLALVMLLGGLWHGAAWNFVLWGGLHGTLLIVERLLAERRRSRDDTAPRRAPNRLNAQLANFIGQPAFRVVLTFAIVCVTWVFFRCESLPHVWRFLGAMFGFGVTSPATQLVRSLLLQPYFVAVMGFSATIVWCAPQTWDFTRRLTAPRACWALSAFAASVLILTLQSYNPFIYFIF